MAIAQGSEWARLHYGKECVTPKVLIKIFGRSMAVPKGPASRAFRRIDLVFRRKSPAYYRTICSTPDSGTYNCRNIAGSGSPSFHSWPLAIDLRWSENGRDGDRVSEMRSRGMNAIRQLRQEDFVWGGDWSNPDDMHIELSQTAAQLRNRYFWTGHAKPWYRRKVGKL